MNSLLLICILYWLGPIAHAQNGRIISRQPYQLQQFDTLMQRIATRKSDRWQYKPDYAYLNEVALEELFYESDGLKVKAYAAYPREGHGPWPAIIYNRGGNRAFGALNEYKIAFIMARVASWGYVVIGSQYRGNDGGEGQEEFGGADVHDVLNLIPLLEQWPGVDANKIGMFGWSRGGMMTYLALMQTDRIKAAAVGGALADLDLMDKSRGGEMGQYVFSELIPGYTQNRDSVLLLRSAVYHADKLCKTTPILLLHGTADWRVVPEESLHMALALQKARVPYRLVMFEGGDHALSEHRDEVYAMIKAWLQKYVVEGAPLPDLHPHGK